MAHLAARGSRRRRLGVVAALLGACGLVLAIAMSGSDDATPAPAGTPAPAAASSESRRDTDLHDRGLAATTPAAGDEAAAIDEEPELDAVLRAKADPADEAVDVLVTALDSTDAIVAAEAANGLVGRGAVSALPALVAFDVSGRPWAAPSVIDAMGRIGAVAGDDERGEVIERLIALLEQEKRRGARESQGNLLQIYEALGHTGDTRAIAPLERELVDASVATPPKVVIVQALVRLGATQSRPALEQVRGQLETRAAGSDLEAEFRRDLLAVIQDALVQLS